MVSPYNSWDTNQLSSYLQSKGKEAKNEAAASKDSLLSQVKANWYETESNAHSAWLNVKDWILDTWTESQLKAFADKHGIPGKSRPGGALLSSLNVYSKSNSWYSSSAPPA